MSEDAVPPTESMSVDDNSNTPAPGSLGSYTPGPDAVDITPNKDGGVLKEIKQQGTGDSYPHTDDKVSVHYVGTLTDGSKFDSSRDRGEKFEFDLGKGSVIKAWDIGVATMKKGEIAVLTCKSEYAYGESGSPPKIPPNATLVFEVELFDWKGNDVSENQDGGVFKSQLQAGEGYSSPNDCATCEIHLVGKCNGQVFEDRDVSFVMGEGSEVGLLNSVEYAIRKFKKAEKALLTVASRYGYGTSGNTEFNIPPNADLEYEVKLKTFEKVKESWEMDEDEKLEQADMMKGKGTSFFKKGKLVVALRYYKKVVSFLENETSYEGDKAEKRKALLLAVFLNLAMCHLKQGEDLEACAQCDKALELDPSNEKGLFRRGTARLNLKEFEEALNDFRAVLVVDPNNKAAKNQVVLTTQKIKKQHDTEKKLYSNLFRQMIQTESKEDKQNDEAEKEKMDETAEPIAEANKVHSTGDSLPETEPMEA
ncbi:Peptidyl-prolyl cis-trans isomerase FKBP4 [Lamellibrachia satsuma]|nr:Peptidyl-prolyl cis-trans isomerase FKBP4 [Lamellibrachia satsuma]